MADEIAHEVRWGCGCHEVNGKLEVECSQTPLQGEISAARHATAKPFSAKCFRKSRKNVAVSLTDVVASDSGNVVTISSDPTE